MDTAINETEQLTEAEIEALERDKAALLEMLRGANPRRERTAVDDGSAKLYVVGTSPGEAAYVRGWNAMLDALDRGVTLNRRLMAAITTHQQSEPAVWDRTDPASVLAVMRALESRYGAILGDLREWCGALRTQPVLYRDELYTRLDNAIVTVSGALSTAQLERHTSRSRRQARRGPAVSR